MNDKLVRYADSFCRDALSISYVDDNMLIKKAFWGALLNVLRGAASVAVKAAPRAAAAVATKAPAIAAGAAAAARGAGSAIAGAARSVAAKASIGAAQTAARAELAAIEKGLSTEAATAFRTMTNQGLSHINQLPPSIRQNLSRAALTETQRAITQSAQIAGRLSRLQRVATLGTNISTAAKTQYASALASAQQFASAPLSTRAGQVMLGVSVLAGFLVGPPNFKTQEGQQIGQAVPKAQPIIPMLVQSGKEAVAILEGSKKNIQSPEQIDSAVTEINSFITALGNLSAPQADDPSSASSFTANVRAAEEIGVNLVGDGKVDTAITVLKGSAIDTAKIEGFIANVGGFLTGINDIRGKAAVAVYKASPLKKESWVQLALFIIPLVGMAGRYIANMTDSLNGLKSDLDNTAALADKQLQEGAGKYASVFQEYSQAAKQASSLVEKIKTPPKTQDDPEQINAAIQFSNAANIILSSMQKVLTALSQMQSAGSYVGEALHMLSLDFGLFDATRYQAFQNAFSRMSGALNKTVMDLENVITKAQNDAGTQVAIEQAKQQSGQSTAPATGQEAQRSGGLTGMESVSI